MKTINFDTVRVTHISSNTSIICDESNNKYTNKEKAIKLLKEKLELKDIDNKDLRIDCYRG